MMCVQRRRAHFVPFSMCMAPAGRLPAVLSACRRTPSPLLSRPHSLRAVLCPAPRRQPRSRLRLPALSAPSAPTDPSTHCRPQVWLARLGAHPGRSWLSSYLDVLQVGEEGRAGGEGGEGEEKGGSSDAWRRAWE